MCASFVCKKPKHLSAYFEGIILMYIFYKYIATGAGDSSMIGGRPVSAPTDSSSGGDLMSRFRAPRSVSEDVGSTVHGKFTSVV